MNTFVWFTFTAGRCLETFYTKGFKKNFTGQLPSSTSRLRNQCLRRESLYCMMLSFQFLHLTASVWKYALVLVTHGCCMAFHSNYTILCSHSVGNCELLIVPTRVLSIASDYTCFGQSQRRIPPVPVRTPERSSRCGGQR